MITSLFSIFDPSLSLFSFSLLFRLLPLLLLPPIFWGARSSYSLFSLVILFVKGEVGYVLHNPVKGCFSFIGGIFIFIVVNNFLALFPFIFSMTSHMMVTLPVSYSLWLGVIIFRLVKSFKHFLAHLIPVGTPLALMRFIVLVEILRNFIRPIALTFRLTANIIAGHLLISLIGGALLGLPIISLLVGSILQFLLVCIELGVSIIQSYVFSTLLLLYLSEREH